MNACRRFLFATLAMTLSATVGASSLSAATDAATAPSIPTSAPATRIKLPLPPTDRPNPRPNARTGLPDSGWMKRHDALVALAKKGNIDLYFEGDSITDQWSNGKKFGKLVWDKEFLGWKPGNFGISGDRTEHVLYRLENGELDGVTPKAVVLMIGTNNSADYTSEEIAAGVKAIVKEFRDKEPQAKILLLAIFPRGDVSKDNPPDKKRKANEGANKIIATFDDGEHVKFLNINDKFPTPGTPEFKAIMPDLLHPNAKGYQIWADAIKPTLTEWLGAPAATEPAMTAPAETKPSMP